MHSSLAPLGSDFAGLFADHRGGHDEIQIDRFILGKNYYGSPYGLYRQALRELMSRTRSLFNEYSELELVEVDIDEIKSNISLPRASVFERRRASIRLRQLDFEQSMRRNNISAKENEWCRFYAWARAMKEVIGEVTVNDRLEFWVAKLTCDSAYRMMTGQSPSWSTIHALPVEARDRVLAQLKDTESLFSRIKSCDLPSVSVEIPLLSHEQVKEMVHAAINTPSFELSSGEDDASPSGLLATSPA